MCVCVYVLVKYMATYKHLNYVTMAMAVDGIIADYSRHTYTCSLNQLLNRQLWVRMFTLTPQVMSKGTVRFTNVTVSSVTANHQKSFWKNHKGSSVVTDEAEGFGSTRGQRKAINIVF